MSERGQFRSCTVVITTKNRRGELRTAISSALAQSVRPDVLVVDDGSTDGTAEMVKAEFSTVRLEHSTESLGLVVQRNRAAHLVKSEIIFSIDDDAKFSDPMILEQTLKCFANSRVGAVAIPFVDVCRGPEVKQQSPDDCCVYATDQFIGTAHAVRRDIFLRVGGYRELLFHQGEEGDFSVRMLAAGWLTVLGSSRPIHHFESPKRDFRRMDFYGCRNAILFAWLNVPWPALPVYLAATTFNCLRWSLSPPRFWVRLSGILTGYRDCYRLRNARRPVTMEIYRLHRKLRSGGPLRLEEIEGKLPPLRQEAK